MSVKINENYQLLKANYIFSEIDQRVEDYQNDHPQSDIIRMGVGDVTRPLTPTVEEAFRNAVREMGDPETFRGYGPYQGYDFLLDNIIEKDYASLGIKLERSEVFVSDGAKCDTGNIQ